MMKRFIKWVRIKEDGGTKQVIRCLKTFNGMGTLISKLPQIRYPYHQFPSLLSFFCDHLIPHSFLSLTRPSYQLNPKRTQRERRQKERGNKEWKECRGLINLEKHSHSHLFSYCPVTINSPFPQTLSVMQFQQEPYASFHLLPLLVHLLHLEFTKDKPKDKAASPPPTLISLSNLHFG